MHNRFASMVFALVLPTVAAAAQATLKVNPDVLHVGSKAEIIYSNPALANGTAVVVIDDGSWPTPAVQEVLIHLDGNGCGQTSWVVPAWDGANFNAPGGVQTSRSIE